MLCFYDVLNHNIIDSSLNPNGISERECVTNHLDQAGKNDKILYDRGYLAFLIYALHIMKHHNFLHAGKNISKLTVKDFIKRKRKKAIVTFHPNKCSIKTCKDKNLPVSPISLRLVRVVLTMKVKYLLQI